MQQWGGVTFGCAAFFLQQLRSTELDIAAGASVQTCQVYLARTLLSRASIPLVSALPCRARAEHLATNERE